MKKRLIALTTFALCIAGPQSAWSADLGERIQVNGFFSVVGTYGDFDGGVNAFTGMRTKDEDITYNNLLASDQFDADLRDTRFGLQISADVAERIGLTAQLLARGGQGGFDVEADWAYASFNLTDAFKVRTGKVKFPTFLVSDFVEVGYAYLWIRPPEEVYSLNPITTLVGGDFVYAPQIGPVSLLVQPYYGTRNFEGTIPAPVVDANNLQSAMMGLDPTDPGQQAYFFQKGQTIDVKAKDLAGINFSVGTDVFTFRLGYLQTDVSAPAFGLADQTAEFASVGFNVDWRNFIAIGEYATRDQDKDLELAFPDQDAWYTTVGFRIGRATPHVTYAKLEDGGQEFVPAGPMGQRPLPVEQESITLGVRWELADTADFKFEVKQIEADSSLQAPFNSKYGLFDEVTDEGMLYNLAVDVIF